MAEAKNRPTTQSVASHLDAIDDDAHDGAADLLAQLGKHKIGKACLYINKLADVKLPVLEKLLVRAVAETKRRYPITSVTKG